MGIAMFQNLMGSPTASCNAPTPPITRNDSSGLDRLQARATAHTTTNPMATREKSAIEGWNSGSPESERPIHGSSSTYAPSWITV
jgi:hypothetical protein